MIEAAVSYDHATALQPGQQSETLSQTKIQPGLVAEEGELLEPRRQRLQ